MAVSNPLGMSSRIYRALLWAYPAEFRCEYGSEMLRAFLDSCREKIRRADWGGVASLWLRSLIDLAITAPGEHMDILLRDLRFALRVMRQRPLFTIGAVVALALGIGANSAIFSMVSTVVLKPLPYEHPERLVWLSGNNLPSGIKDETASGPDFLDWRKQDQSFEDMACLATWQPVLTNAGEPERLSGGAVSVAFFKVMGINPAVGRAFTIEEDQQPEPESVILSYGLWQRRFGGERDVLGRTLTLNGTPRTVIGIMPADFLYPNARPAEIWTLYSTPQLAARRRRGDHLGVVGRLRPGVLLPQAAAEMNTIAIALERQYPESNSGWRVTATPLLERAVSGIKPALFILLGSVGFLLLIACANVANLMLVRGMGRQREIALRTALGAARGRLTRQLLTESVLLAGFGGAAGLGLAYYGIRGLVAIAPAGVPRIDQVAIDFPVLAFTLAATFLTGIAFGLVPALQISNPRLNEVLKEGSWGSTQAVRSNRMRGMMTVAEVALALVLLIGAGLMIRSYLKLQSVTPGFNPDRLLTFRLSLPPTRYPEQGQIAAFYDQLLDRVKALPGISGAGAASDPPFLAANYLSFGIEGRPPVRPGNAPDAEVSVVNPDYFHAMTIPLTRGRLFSPGDRGGDARLVALISETMAQHYWRNQDPIGKRIAFDTEKGQPRWREIIGIVGSTRSEGLDANPYAQLYVPFAQDPQRSMTLLLRTDGDPMGMVPAVREALRALDKDQPIFNLRTMEQVLDASVARQRLSTLLLGMFAALALILAGVGIYGVMAYSVSLRTHEIGVRMALGARGGDVLRLVIRQGMVLALTGMALGLVAAAGLARLIGSMLYEVEPLDPATFIAIPILLIATALLACYVPARRATRVDPMIALRCE